MRNKLYLQSIKVLFDTDTTQQCKCQFDNFRFSWITLSFHVLTWQNETYMPHTVETINCHDLLVLRIIVLVNVNSFPFIRVKPIPIMGLNHYRKG